MFRQKLEWGDSEHSLDLNQILINKKAVLGWRHIVTPRALALSQACLSESPQNGRHFASQLCSSHGGRLIHILIPSALTITVRMRSAVTN